MVENDSKATPDDVPQVAIDVLVNDSNVDGDAPTVDSTTQRRDSGVATINADGTTTTHRPNLSFPPLTALFTMPVRLHHAYYKLSKETYLVSRLATAVSNIL